MNLGSVTSTILELYPFTKYIYMYASWGRFSFSNYCTVTVENISFEVLRFPDMISTICIFSHQSNAQTSKILVGLANVCKTLFRQKKVGFLILVSELVVRKDFDADSLHVSSFRHNLGMFPVYYVHTQEQIGNLILRNIESEGRDIHGITKVKNKFKFQNALLGVLLMLKICCTTQYLDL